MLGGELVWAVLTGCCVAGPDELGVVDDAVGRLCGVVVTDEGGVGPAIASVSVGDDGVEDADPVVSTEDIDSGARLIDTGSADWDVPLSEPVPSGRLPDCSTVLSLGLFSTVVGPHANATNAKIDTSAARAIAAGHRAPLLIHTPLRYTVDGPKLVKSQ